MKGGEAAIACHAPYSSFTAAVGRRCGKFKQQMNYCTCTVLYSINTREAAMGHNRFHFLLKHETAG